MYLPVMFLSSSVNAVPMPFWHQPSDLIEQVAVDACFRKAIGSEHKGTFGKELRKALSRFLDSFYAEIGEFSAGDLILIGSEPWLLVFEGEKGPQWYKLSQADYLSYCGNTIEERQGYCNLLSVGDN